MPRTKAVRRKLPRSMAAIFSLVAAALAPALAYADPCTDGVDCHCDKVRDPSNPAFDDKLLACEDWEARSLTENVPAGGGAPDFGPWYDETGFPGGRGFNSYMGQTYGPANQPCGWRQSMPTPKLGSTCTFENCWTGEWSAGDPWDSNSFACLDALRDGEFDDEVSTLPAPLLPGGGSGVFDGQQTMGFRVGQGQTAGGVGWVLFNKVVTEVGITMALAYAANIADSGIWTSPWKHDEWAVDTDISRAEPWTNGNFGSGEPPYSPVLFMDTARANRADCEAAMENATLTIGSVVCNDLFFWYGAGEGHFDPSFQRIFLGEQAPTFSQARDFPWGTWGCVRAHRRGMGTANMELRLWHNEVLIFELTGFDGTILKNSGYDGFVFNHYANANQGVGGETPTTETTYRYQDNVHVREGVPASCEDIGYKGIPPSAPPPPVTPPPVVPLAPILLD